MWGWRPRSLWFFMICVLKFTVRCRFCFPMGREGSFTATQPHLVKDRCKGLWPEGTYDETMDCDSSPCGFVDGV